MRLSSHSLTHPGLRRESNEDSYTDRLGLGLFVVADGMGGHAAGEVASKVAADTIEAFIEETDNVGPDFTWPFGYDPSVGQDGTRLRSAFLLANRAIGTRTLDDPALHGMATTAVALLVSVSDRNGAGTQPAVIPAQPAPAFEPGAGTQSAVIPAQAGTQSAVIPAQAGTQPVVIPAQPAPAFEPGAGTQSDEPTALNALVAHVGDSRAYLFREGRLEQITRDHSWVEEQIASGEITEEEARVHPWRNLVTRAIAGGEDPLVDLTPLALEPGDRVLLCSDGLCGPVRDDVIAGIIGRSPRGEGMAVCEALVDAANAVGGPDNITVVLVEVA